MKIYINYAVNVHNLLYLERSSYCFMNAPFTPFDGDQPFIFVSYAHADSQRIFPVLEELNSRGCNIWYDGGINLHATFASSTLSKVSTCSQYVIFLSQNCADSYWVNAELCYAAQSGCTNYCAVMLESNIVIPAAAQAIIDSPTFKKINASELSSQRIAAELATILGAGEVAESGEKSVSAPSIVSTLGDGMITLGKQTFSFEAAELDFTGDRLTDLSPLRGMPNLQRLVLWGNNVTDLSPLSEIRSLRSLDVSCNSDLSDLSPIAQLVGLTELNLSNNTKIKDLAPISNLTALQVLNLWRVGLKGAQPLAGLTELTFLKLGGSRIEDGSFLAGLTNLRTLDLYNNDLRDSSPLAGLTQLTNLDLYNNYVSDLTPLAGLVLLERLDLERNKFTDITPLLALTALTHLDVSHNSISAEDVERLRQAFPNARIVCKN